MIPLVCRMKPFLLFTKITLTLDLHSGLEVLRRGGDRSFDPSRDGQFNCSHKLRPKIYYNLAWSEIEWPAAIVF
jgi:hypothetical protein